MFPKSRHFLSTLTATFLLSFSPLGETGFFLKVPKVKAQVPQPPVGAHRRAPNQQPALKPLSFPVPGETGFFLEIPEVKTLLPKTRFLTSKQTAEEQIAEADRLLEQGDQYLEAGEYQEALQVLQEAYAIYKQTSNPNAIQAVIRLGYAYAYLGETDEATEIFEALLTVAQEKDIPQFVQIAQEGLQLTQNLSQSSLNSGSSSRAEADRLLEQGVEQYNANQNQAAIQSYQGALNLYQEINDHSGISMSLNNLGLVYERLEEYKTAIDYMQRSLVIKEEMSDWTGVSNSLNGLGVIYEGLGEYKTAIDYYQRSLNISEEIGNQAGISRSLNGLGVIYERLGEYETAIDYHQRSLGIFEEMGDQADIVRSLNGLGIIYERLGEYETAIDYMQRSLGIFEEMGDQAGIARYFNDLGLVYERLGEYETAIDYHQRSLAIFKEMGNQAEMARSLNNLGLVYERLEEYEIAIDYHQRFLNISEEIGDQTGIARSLGNLGDVYESLGEYKTARDYYQSSLAIFEEMGDRTGMADSFNRLGVVFNRFGEYEIARDYHQRSLAISEKIGYRSGIANSFNRLGLVYRRLGEYEEALDYFQRSLAISEEINNRSVISASLNNLGIVYESLGEYRKAIDYHQRSLAISEEIGDRSALSNSLNNLGSIYETLGEYETAIDYHQRSLAISEETGDQTIESYALNNLGIVYESLGEYEKAIDYHQRSLIIRERIGDQSALPASLTALGAVYSRVGEYEKSINYYQRSLAISEEIGDRAAVSTSLNGLGVVFNRLGEYEKAIDYYQRSLIVFEKIGERSGTAIALNNLGVVFKAQNQPNLAILFYKQSVNEYESIRENIKGLSTKQQQSFINTIEFSYRNLANLLIQQDRILEAQRVLDLLKIQELDDFLEDVRGNENTKKGIALLPPEKEIWSGYEQIIQEAIKVTPELNRLRQVQPEFRSPEQLQEIARLDSQYKEIVAQLTPFLNSSTVKQTLATLTPATIKRIELEQITALQNDLQSLDQNVVLLYSVIFDDRLDLILTTPNSPPIRKTVPISKTELNQTILDFRQVLTSPYEDALTPAQKLYDLVIKPIETELKEANADTIIYAPDAQFRYIPLAALHDGEKWLTERFQINHITALALTDLKQKSQPDINILAGAFANGFYQFKEGETDFRFSGLSGAEAEVQNLGELFPNTTLMDTVFNPGNTVPKMENHSIVHLATHAAFVVGKPEASFILFGDGSRTNLRDVEKEWNLNNVDLVVLSACETGVNGQFGSGQEILGFGYLMQLAGARGSLSSLWEVSDSGTQVLMSAFYDRLQDKEMTNIEALQQAQIALINNDEEFIEEAFRGLGFQNNRRPKLSETGYSHPYYWSPFILIGNGL